jgi:plastocyanin
MMSMTWRSVVVVAALGCAVCGGTTSMDAPAPAPTPSPAAVANRSAARAVAVTVKNFEFGPRTLKVVRGDRVRWTNRDSANHTVTFSRGPKQLGNLDPGEHRQARFTHVGRYTYVCQYHPGMRGTVVVRAR